MSCRLGTYHSTGLIYLTWLDLRRTLKTQWMFSSTWGQRLNPYI